MTVFKTAFKAALCLALLAPAASAMADGHFVLKRNLDTQSSTTCTGETAFGDFVADAMKKRNGADIGFVSCASIRGEKTYAAGASFTPVAVAFELPDGRKTTVIEVTGAQILDVMEQAVSALPQQANTFAQVSGLRVVVDLKQPVGMRIVKITTNGAALDIAKSYKVATTDDVATGAAGFAMFKSAKTIGGGSLVADDVSAHLNDKGVKDIKILGRIKILK